MCRHLAYMGPPTTLKSLLIEGPHALYEQSWRPLMQRHGTVNADGFGFGWYPAPKRGGSPEAPARYRRAVPIWADANLPDLARTVRSGAVLAAVRSATEGTTQDESAAAPFQEGQWLFSHNGAVADWGTMPVTLTSEELLGVQARSDSALLWAMVLRRLRRGEQVADALAAVVGEVAAARPTARLNLLLTDGISVAATTWGDTLWYWTGEDSVTIASEPGASPADVDAAPLGTAGPATDGGVAVGPWQRVPDRCVLLASPADGVQITALPPSRPTEENGAQ
ncbi:ergothioneine biosynthesis protein EgtC [Streptomyces sp. 049-1]|uniref:ergothioneine biosynthesis protein EgtC n=1 Tax=Streptomyces sp. 049-1 TaxID=2789264 RepID=UPI0039809E84